MALVKERQPTLRPLKVTDQPIDIVDLPDEVDLNVHDMLHSKPAKAIEILLGYLETFPDHPVLLNWLIAAYQTNDQYEKALPLIKKNYAMHPTYLFAKIQYGTYELEKKRNHKAVLTVFNNILWLPNLYPERDVFHRSEFESFYNLVGLYYYFDDQLENMRAIIDLLDTLDSNPSLVGKLEMLLNIKVGLARLMKGNMKKDSKKLKK